MFYQCEEQGLIVVGKNLKLVSLSFELQEKLSNGRESSVDASLKKVFPALESVSLSFKSVQSLLLRTKFGSYGDFSDTPALRASIDFFPINLFQRV